LWPSLATRLTFGYNRGNAFGPEWIECADFLPSGNFFWNVPQFFCFCWLGKKVATPNIEGCFSFGEAEFFVASNVFVFVAQSSNLTEGQMDENGKRKQ
jgi:hypothetical protein